MALSTHTKNRLLAYLDTNTSLGLKLGGGAVVLSTLGLIVAVYGGSLHRLNEMNAAEGEHLVNTVLLATQVLKYASVVLVASIVLRFFNDEATGQACTIVGALITFALPPFLAATVMTDVIARHTPFTSIVAASGFAGRVCLIPGLVLLVRDAILRIWTGISVRRVMDRRWGDEEERENRHRLAKVYAMCWHMAFCRSYVKNVCPAFKAHKPCWRIKVGCYCDEKTIFRAMTASGAENAHMQGILKNLGLDKPRDNRLSKSLKRARCRRCIIYAEHQRQKYRLLSPMMFPLVGLLVYTFYDKIVGWLWQVMESTDKLMRLLAYRPGIGYSFSDDRGVLITLALVSVSMIVVSYALRLLEYFIFELQV